MRAAAVGLAVSLSFAAPGAAPAAQDMQALSFMSGCWRAPIEGGFMEEIYTEPTSNLMLGTTRYVRGDSAVDFEFSRIEKGTDGVFLHPYPGGRPSANGFRLTRVGAGEASFEAPEHDFPRRIRYRRLVDGSLEARIDDGTDDGRARQWVLTTGPCPGSPEH